MTATNKVFHGECLQFLKDTNKIPDNYVDLIMTSPPYAEKRSKSYGGIPANKYSDWFLPISEQLIRVLKDNGSFILNLKNIRRMENGKLMLLN